MPDEEPDLNFDLSKKKKKKKKLDLGDEGGEGEAAETAEAADALAENVDDLSLDLGAKKKKKKKKEGEEGEAEKKEGAEDDLGDLSKKKKKKKKTTIDLADFEDVEEQPEEGEQEQGARPSSGLPWEGTSRDYHYEEILGRVFSMLRAKNPEMAGERRKTILKPPEVLREGTKKTVFVNFMELCKAMHRQPDHVMGYLHAELGTSGSLDGQQRLIIKGRFTPKNFEGILRRYVNEYVICNMCKSTDTLLVREQRLFILRCQQCGASRSVAALKTGFVAQVGRRKRA